MILMKKYVFLKKNRVPISYFKNFNFLHFFSFSSKESRSLGILKRSLKINLMLPNLHILQILKFSIVWYQIMKKSSLTRPYNSCQSEKIDIEFSKIKKWNLNFFSKNFFLNFFMKKTFLQFVENLILYKTRPKQLS